MSEVFMPYNLITILGPTATGKTKLAVKLAKEFNGEIISADSRQVYREMNIGTGKDLEDYILDGSQISYHMIDVIDPTEEFDLYKFNRLFYEIYEQIIKNNKIPFLVGGTGLYLNSILKGYTFAAADFSKESLSQFNKYSTEELRGVLLELNPNLHNTTDLLDKARVIKAIILARSQDKSFSEQTKVNSLVIGIKLPRSEIEKRITERLKNRLKSGMIDEVGRLLKKGISYEKLEFFGLEYKYMGLYLKKEFGYNDMFQRLNSAIHNFAKKQMTWFRKMEKEGIKINWIEGPNYDEASKIIKQNFVK
jgi:tRNA dimethylallyltransferase